MESTFNEIIIRIWSYDSNILNITLTTDIYHVLNLALMTIVDDWRTVEQIL